MQNRSFQAYPITLYSNKEQYRVCLNPITDMWELRSAQGRRLNASRDIFVLAKQIQDKDTLIIPKGTEHVDWIPDSVFNEIQEYSILLKVSKLIGEKDLSKLTPPEYFKEILNFSREQLITLGFMFRVKNDSVSHPQWWFNSPLKMEWINYALYAEKPFT